MSPSTLRDANFCGNCAHADKNVTYSGAGYYPGLNHTLLFCTKNGHLSSSFLICDEYQRENRWVGMTNPPHNPQ